MIYQISIILYRYKYRIEKIDRYPALIPHTPLHTYPPHPHPTTALPLPTPSPTPQPPYHSSLITQPTTYPTPPHINPTIPLLPPHPFPTHPNPSPILLDPFLHHTTPIPLRPHPTPANPTPTYPTPPNSTSMSHMLLGLPSDPNLSHSQPESRRPTELLFLKKAHIWPSGYAGS